MGGPNPRGSQRPRVTTPLIEEHPTPNRPLGLPEAPGACPPAAVGGRVRCTRCPEKPASRPKAPSPVAGEQEDGVRRGRGIRGTWGGEKTAGWGGKRKSEPRAGSPHLPDPAARRSHLCRPLRSAHLSAEDATERGWGLRILRKARCDSEEPRENVINAKRRLHWMV